MSLFFTCCTEYFFSLSGYPFFPKLYVCQWICTVVIHFGGKIAVDLGDNEEIIEKNMYDYTYAKDT